MSTIKKLPATSGKGSASGQRVRRNSGRGQFQNLKEPSRSQPKGGHLVTTVTGVPSGDRGKMLSSIKKGLRFRVIGKLEKALDASQKEVAQLLSIPPSTLTRRKKDGHLNTDESDRVVRYARLKDAALAMAQGDDKAAISWLRTPLDILGDESPLEHAGTELGARDVEDLIGRLRYGVFS